MLFKFAATFTEHLKVELPVHAPADWSYALYVSDKRKHRKFTEYYFQEKL